MQPQVPPWAIKVVLEEEDLESAEKPGRNGEKMNIKQAKEYIKDSVFLYLKKDEFGEYKIPVVRQRPIFLLGAPGIGKTAVMEQIAQEMGIALVSYSMTHHTRQSALGLPLSVIKSMARKNLIYRNIP